MPQSIRVAKAYDIPAGEGATVYAGSIRIAVFNVDGVYHAISDACIHAGASLGEGRLEGEMVVCPLHGWRFNVKTGISDFDGGICLDRYDVRISGMDLYISL
tara:strand:+ start:92 stop:397 length:306 start_codon:yes stop_codon:yes gene_type:complete